MSNELDLTSLKNALASLRRGLARYVVAPEDEELRDACIQRFDVAEIIPAFEADALSLLTALQKAGG